MGNSTTLKTPQQKKFDLKKELFAYFLLITGSLIFAVGDVMFANPYHLAPGGTYGLSNVLHSIFPWKISYYAACMDIPLLIIGTIILGPKFGIKTIVSTFVILGGVWLIESTWGYDPVIHNGSIPYAEGLTGDYIIHEGSNIAYIPDYFLNTIVTGLVYGIAIGMIFKSGATSGGSDIISMILNKYTHISLGTLVMIVDTTITLSTLFISGQIRLPIYSIIVVLIEGKVIDMIVDGVKTYKTAVVISNQPDLVKEIVTTKIQRGGTIIEGKGMYKGEDRTIIYVTLSRTEFVTLKESLSVEDPNAFINVLNSSEVLGNGFKQLTHK